MKTQRTQWSLMLGALLLVVACGDEALLAIEERKVAVERHPRDVTDVRDDEEPAERVDPPTREPLICPLVMRDQQYVFDIEEYGDGLVVTTYSGVWRYQGGVGTLLDPRWSFPLARTPDGFAYVTAESELAHVDPASGTVTDLYAPSSDDTSFVDLVVRGDELWITESTWEPNSTDPAHGEIFSFDRTTRERRALAPIQSASPSFMHDAGDVAYVAVPAHGIARLDATGTASLAYDPPTLGLFYAVSKMASSSEWLFFTTYLNGGLARVHRETEEMEVLISEESFGVLDVLVINEKLYWLERDFDDWQTSRVFRANLDATDPELVLDPDCTPWGASLATAHGKLYVMLEGFTLEVPLE